MYEPQEKTITQLKSIRQKQIFNRLNALHYQSIPLLACLQHKNHERCIYLKARPEPVSNEKVTAAWIENEFFPPNLDAFELVKIILSSNRGSYEFSPDTYHLGNKHLLFTVPESAVEASYRKHQRFACEARKIPVTLAQSAIVFKGRLLDFSANGILVDLDYDDNHSLGWLNGNLTALLTVMSGDDPVYTGQVSLSSRSSGQYLLTPNFESTPRYMPKQYRARRQQFVPSPDLLFEHPITGKRHSLKICDLSSLGFSVEEDKSRGSLIPGLLIRHAKISFASNFSLSCMAQVVYYRTNEENPKYVRIGFAILHIDIEDHLRLINLVQQARDPNAYISNQIDPSDLFDFFFETGFLYPHKYAEIAEKREEVTRSYMELYEKGVGISRHFIYQNFGQILGHFSTLRVYRQTWMNQHHAALNSQRAGLRVVRAISEYLNDSYQLNPTNIRYIIGYYRASNKFPQHYFGEYVREANNPKMTSLDCLSYVNEARKLTNSPATLFTSWSLEMAEVSDLVEFHGYYQNISGGLLPEALDMGPDEFRNQTLSDTYKANNLVRQRSLHALRYQGAPKALIDVQTTDFGLNLSEITNAITVYLIDPLTDYFPMMQYAINKLALQYGKMSDPVMFFPNNYLNLCGFSPDKEYTLWALDIFLGSDSYMTWMNRYCR